MKIYPGKKVRIRVFKKRPIHWNNNGLMDKYMGKEFTIKERAAHSDHWFLCEDGDFHWFWIEEDFEEIPINPMEEVEELFEI